MIYIEDSDAGPGIASRLGVKPGTVRHWRTRGRGPRTWVVNGRVASTPEDIAEYLKAAQAVRAVQAKQRPAARVA